ncbi:hypothetical protein [Massilia sp. 9I]|uniref:hypothetical protein n=1 Tax=Massilia sp. 9I TaxID=2653152 RepID=UPI0012EFE486|nr:hypothetical protein [Massilia sp. 9I]VXB29448.1 conserved membrane hypothetical protein [Massilia sp. 9I]
MQASDTPAAAPNTTILQVPHGAGLAWLAAGWACFRRRWQPLVVLSAGALILVWLLGTRGGILYPMVATIYLGTVAAYCRMDREGEAFLAGSGAWRNPSLWLLALILAAVSMVQVMIVGAIATGAAMQGLYSATHFGKGMFYAFAFAQLLVMLVFSTIWMAPALVVERRVKVGRALVLSVAASLRNPLPFLTVVVLGALMTLVAMLPLGLGLIVAMPVLAAAAARAADDTVA